MRTMNRLWRGVCLAAVASLLCGCAVPTYRVTGKVTRGGEPLKWDSDAGVLEVVFAPMDRKADRNLYHAQTDRKTGAYTVRAIPAGTYRVSIQQMDPYPTFDLLGV